MPKEVLLEIISKKLFLELALIIVLYFLAELIFLKLGFKLNGVIVKLKNSLIFSLLCLVLYSLIGKQFLPGSLYGMVYVLILAILLWSFGKIEPIKAFFSSFIIMLIIGLGTTIIHQPLAFLNKDFLPGTPMGVAIGTIIEAALPAIMLFLIPLFNVPSGSAKSKATRIDFLGMITFAVLFFIIYYLSVLLLWLYKNNSISIAILILQVILFGLAGLIFFYISKIKQKKQLEQEQFQTHLDQSYRLMEVFFSERREYRNQLQVMNLMAATSHNKELNDYIFKIIEEMVMTSLNNIQNPILAVAIVSRQVRAKENGIAIVIHCATPLQDFSFNPVKLGKLFEIILDLLIGNELIAMSATKMIFVYIKENAQEYFFDFENSEATVSNLKNVLKEDLKELIAGTGMVDQKNKLKLAEELIKELGGKSALTKQGDYLVRLKVTIKKTRKSNLFEL